MIEFEERVRKNLDNLREVMLAFSRCTKKYGELVLESHWKEELKDKKIEDETFKECIDLLLIQGNIMINRTDGDWHYYSRFCGL